MELNQFIQLLPLLPVMLAVMAAGYWLWIRPRPSLDPSSRGLMILLLLALAGGFMGAFVWWPGVPGTFAWTLPPLAGRMLAAAGWAFAVVCAMALSWPSRRRVRLALWMLAVYLAPIAAAILVAHRDRFDWAAPISYAFLAIVGVMLAATAWYLVRQPDIPAAADDPAPTSDLARKWLALVGGVTLAWGIALFVTDHGSTPLVWAWPGDLLTSRLIAVMLLTIAAGCALSLRQAGPARAMLASVLTYGLGVTAAGLWSLTAGKPAPLGYVIIFGLLALGSGLLLAFDRADSLQ